LINKQQGANVDLTPFLINKQQGANVDLTPFLTPFLAV
jgi:hypothetical protein